MQLVVVVETGAGMFELDLGVEDDVVGNGVGRQQDDVARGERFARPRPQDFDSADEDFAIAPMARPATGKSRIPRIGLSSVSFAVLLSSCLAALPSSVCSAVLPSSAGLVALPSAVCLTTLVSSVGLSAVEAVLALPVLLGA